MGNAFDRFIENQLQKNSINEEDKELYIYGYRQGLLMLLNITTTLIIGVVLGMLWYSVLFLIVYTPIRSYAGGAHAKTPLRCYIYSIVLTILVLLVIKYTPWTDWLGLVVLLAASAIIFTIAPVQSRTKPLSDIEVSVYRRRVRYMLSVLAIVSILLLLLGYTTIVAGIAVSMVALCIMLLIEMCSMYLSARR